MQIEALKMFCDVARLGSFTRAAKENGVTQSTISQTMQQIEKHLGVSLVDRSLRPWKLTQEGRIYYEGCRQIIDQYCEIEMRVKNFHDKINAVLRVACIYSVGLRLMDRFCKKYSELYPRIKVDLEYLHPSKIYDKVRDEEIDIGIVSFPESDRQIECIPWQMEPMVLACDTKHPIGKKKSIRISDLTGHTFVAFDKGLVIRREVDRFLKKSGANAEIVLEFDNIEAIKRAIEAGSGISILPKPALSKEVNAGTIKAVSLAGSDFVRPLGIIHLRGKKLNQNLLRFVDLLKEDKT